MIGATIYAATTTQKQAWLDELLVLIGKGKLKQQHTTYSLQQTAKAQDAIKERKITGRAVIML